LKDSKNPELRERIIQGELDPEFLVRCESKDLANEAIKQQRQKT